MTSSLLGLSESEPCVDTFLLRPGLRLPLPQLPLLHCDRSMQSSSQLSSCSDWDQATADGAAQRICSLQGRKEEESTLLPSAASPPSIGG